MGKPRRSTPAGEHRPVLLQEVLDALRLQPGDTVVDGTMGWAGTVSLPAAMVIFSPEGTVQVV